MDVLLSQRQAWVRTGTHTVVFDHDPEFSRFRWNTTGQIKGLLRVWVILDADADDARLLVADRMQRRQLRHAVIATLRNYKQS